MVGAASHGRAAAHGCGRLTPDRDARGGTRAAECSQFRSPRRTCRHPCGAIMIDSATRAHLSDEMIRRFGGSLRGIQLYSPGHPIVARSLEGLSEALRALHQHDASVVIGILGNE